MPFPFNILRRKTRPQTADKKNAGFAEFVRGGSRRSMSADALAYTKEGYLKNVIVFRCVQIIAQSLANVPLQVADRGGVIDNPNHPLAMLLDRPNPLQSGTALREALVAFRLIAGNSYLEKLIAGSGTVTELWAWTPHHMSVIVPEKGRMPIGYKWEKGLDRHAWEVDQLDGSCPLLHWHTFSPMDDFLGVSPVQPAALSIDQHNAAGEWNARTLQNSAEPSGVLSTEGELTDAQFAQLTQRMKEQHSGPRNARKAMLLEGGLKWQQVSLSPKDMDWLNGRNVSAMDIAAAFGVPSQVIPLPGAQTFANYEQARLALYEDTVLPLLDDLLDSLNSWLAPAFGPGLSIIADLDEVPALATRRAERWTSIQAASWISTNEKREATGYARIEAPEANEILVPAGLVPLTLAGDDEARRIADEANNADGGAE